MLDEQGGSFGLRTDGSEYLLMKVVFVVNCNRGCC